VILLLLIFACGGCSSDLFLSLFFCYYEFIIRSVPFYPVWSFFFSLCKISTPRVHFGGVG
jgi:hypothetical protein